MSEIVDDILRIGNQKIPVKRMEIAQADLIFYPENPRIYSLVYSDDGEPTQMEIEERLQKMDHVKVLIQSIKANGGLIDPIIVRDGDFVVLEGNSRLAAYRSLAKNDPIKWGKVSAVLLPSSIDDDLIFTLLGQYHIIGRKDWSPYEKAGYLWRRQEQHKVTVSVMTKEMGMSESEIRKLISTYAFMRLQNDTDPLHWSYYDEYLKSRAIKKHRDAIPELDEKISDMIKGGEIPAAIDVRDRLQAVAKVVGQKGHNLMIALAEGTKSLDVCFVEAEKCGATNNLYQTLNKFRLRIADPSIKKELKKMEPAQRSRCCFELKKIEEAIHNLRSKFETDDD